MRFSDRREGERDNRCDGGRDGVRCGSDGDYARCGSEGARDAVPASARGVIAHADDFGIGVDQSKRILACSSAAGGSGALNSLSVLVTSPYAAECVELLRPCEHNLRIGLHVNLVEGPCCAPAQSIPLLADASGVFKLGFGGLLLASVLHPAEIRRQLKTEIAAQIDAFVALFPWARGRLRVDSHQHFHMIPAVFDALVAGIEESGCAVEYLRVPAEPRRPFAAAGSAGKVPAINRVKRAVLNALWKRNRRKVPGLADHSAVFCGIGFSGCMTRENVGGVLESFMAYAANRDMPLELLFHPGGVDEASRCLNADLAGFVAFYTSPNRAREAEALAWLQGKLS